MAGVLDRRSVVGVRGQTEQALNVLLFIPLAALSVAAWPRRRPVTVAVAWIAVSVAVELTQALVLTARHPSVRDVALNGTGAVVGALLGAWARHARPGPRP